MYVLLFNEFGGSYLVVMVDMFQTWVSGIDTSVEVA